MRRERSEIVPRDTLASMSTAVLQEMLDRALDVELPEDVNVALIKEITAILSARTGESEIDVDAAYDTFVSEYLGCEMLYPADEFDNKEEASPVKPIRRRRLGRILLLAAAFVVLFVVTVQASGVDILGALARWTEETFEFDVDGEEPADSHAVVDAFSELKWTLAMDGISAKVVPQYLPDGYTYSRIETGNGEYCAVYLKENSVLKLQIHRTQTGNASRMEKNDGEPEIYTVNEIEHHIVTNLQRYSVTWVNEGYECTISGIPSKEDACKMIDSIYWED